MDSLTQFALGAGIGVAVLGRRIGPRRAAIAGGLLGSVPDLDVLYPFDDPVVGGSNGASAEADEDTRRTGGRGFLLAGLSHRRKGRPNQGVPSPFQSAGPIGLEIARRAVG